MLNISIEGEKLILLKGEYFVIDGLFLNDVRDFIIAKEHINDKLLDKLKLEVFRYMDTPFAIIKIDEHIEFGLNRFHKVEYDDISDCINSYLSTDTGLLLFIKKEILVKFIEKYDFDKLVDLDPIDINYWTSIIKDFNTNEIGLIVSPGIDSEHEFDGGGLYQII